MCEICGVYMFLLGSTVAGFGGNWKIDASNEENESLTCNWSVVSTKENWHSGMCRQIKNLDTLV